MAQIDVADCRDCSNNPNIRMPDSYCCSSVTKNPDVVVSETKTTTKVPLMPKNEFPRAFQISAKNDFWIWKQYFVLMKRFIGDGKLTGFSRNGLTRVLQIYSLSAWVTQPEWPKGT